MINNTCIIDVKDNAEYRIYKMNLQLFAGEGDKTEKATARKKQEARKKGQVLHSPEVNSAIILTVAFLSIKIFGGYMYNNISLFTQKILTFYIISNDIFEMATLFTFFMEILFIFAKVSLPVMGAVFVAGLVSNYAQVGFMFTTETIKFNIEKIINPVEGLKRMFSARTFAELIKSLVKLIIISIIVYQYIKAQQNTIFSLMDMSIYGIGMQYSSLIFNIAIRICVTLIILSLFDYLFQWWQYEKQLRMSKQETKDEYKETEGNPLIKSRIRELQRSMSMRRMMQDVPQADVVITNPTHFAIAIKYDAKESPSPMVIAKGQDYIAQRIKEVAKDSGVEIVENKPLARALYSTVEVGDAIPQEMYQAVAEVLAFVYSLKGRK